MAVGTTSQAPAPAVEGAAGVASGSSQAQVDLWMLWSFALGLTVARQGMVLCDPSNPLGAASILNMNPSGGEYAQVVKVSPNAQDATNLLQAVHALTIEIQGLIILFGGTPMTPQPSLGNVSQGMQ